MQAAVWNVTSSSDVPLLVGRRKGVNTCGYYILMNTDSTEAVDFGTDVQTLYGDFVNMESTKNHT
jgi:hypothetical protein